MTFLSITNIYLFIWLFPSKLIRSSYFTCDKKKKSLLWFEYLPMNPLFDPVPGNNEIIKQCYCLQKKKPKQPLLENGWESAKKQPDGWLLLVVCDSTELSELNLNGFCGSTQLLKTTNRSGVQRLASAKLPNHPIQKWQVKDMFEPTSLFPLWNLKPLQRTPLPWLERWYFQGLFSCANTHVQANSQFPHIIWYSKAHPA